MLIFYLTTTRNPAGVNQSIKAGLLTHPESAKDRDTLIDQILFYLNEKGAGLHGIPFSFLNNVKVVQGNLNGTKLESFY